MLTLGGIGYTYVFNDQFNSKYRIRKRNYNILCQLFFWYVQRGIYKYVSSYSKGNVLVIIDFAVVLYMYIRVNNRTLPIVSHRYIFYAFFFHNFIIVLLCTLFNCNPKTIAVEISNYLLFTLFVRGIRNTQQFPTCGSQTTCGPRAMWYGPADAS